MTFFKYSLLPVLSLLAACAGGPGGTAFKRSLEVKGHLVGYGSSSFPDCSMQFINAISTPVDDPRPHGIDQARFDIAITTQYVGFVGDLRIVIDCGPAFEKLTTTTLHTYPVQDGVINLGELRLESR